MPELIFKLRNVPDDEVEEVHALLKENNINYYETSAGNWGVSMPALWLKTDEQLLEAKQLLREYQEQRAIRVKAEYEQDKAAGKNRTLLDEIKEKPLRFFTYVAIIILLIYLPIKLFVGLVS